MRAKGEITGQRNYSLHTGLDWLDDGAGKAYAALVITAYAENGVR